MFEYSCGVTLWIKPTSVNPSDIAARLAPLNDMGCLLKSTTTRKGPSCHLQFNKKYDGLQEAMDEIIPLLMPYKSYFHDLATGGAKLSFFVGWFSHGWNSRGVIRWETLQILADMRISLDLDVYGPDPPSENSN